MLKTLRETFSSHQNSFKKSLGQNFIFDLNLLDKIASSASNIENNNVLEIGGGIGSLTRAILKKNPKKLITIEKDDDLITILKELQDYYPNYQIIHHDALKIGHQEVFDEPFSIIANLPYNISTKLLINWLKIIAQNQLINQMVLMFQKEVALRICASINSKQYGSLSALSQYYCNVKYLFDVKPSCFIPPPKVTSAIIKLTPKKLDYKVNFDDFEKFVRSCFANRRKTLKNNLKNILPDCGSVLSDLGIKENVRAENLTIEEFVELFGFYRS